MAVTNYGRSFTLEAADDERTGMLLLTSLVLSGTGMTAGQRLTLTESDGGLIADHYVEASNENKEFIATPRWVKGVKLSAAPAAGTYTVLGVFD